MHSDTTTFKIFILTAAVFDIIAVIYLNCINVCTVILNSVEYFISILLILCLVYFIAFGFVVSFWDRQ